MVPGPRDEVGQGGRADDRADRTGPVVHQDAETVGVPGRRLGHGPVDRDAQALEGLADAAAECCDRFGERGAADLDQVPDRDAERPLRVPIVE